MRICDITKIKETEYIVLLPSCDNDIRNSVEYSFDNVFYLDYDPTEEDAKTIIDFINNLGNQLILFDYCEFYRMILPHIKKNKKVKWILKNELASMTDGAIRATFTNLMEFYDRNIINEIGCLNKDTSEVLQRAGYNATYIMLDIDPNVKKVKKSDSIGIIGNDYNPNHNIYNELSAIKMIDYSYVKVLKHMPATKHFIEFFEINEKEVATLDEVMKNNFVNLYCNFTLNNREIILKSMDMGIPCLLGNCDIFENFPKLQEYLILKSDDDINEIAEKINFIKKNKVAILEEYEKFRVDYSKKSKSSLISFLNLKKKENNEHKITVEEVKVLENDIEITYSVSKNLKKFFFTENTFKIKYFNSIKSVPKSVAVIPFLTLILPIAWITNSKIEVEEIDEDFYNCINKVQNALNNMHKNVNFNTGKLIASKIIKNKIVSQEQSSIFYSGGVDSLSTLISIKEKNPLLITIWGSDIWLPDVNGWNKAKKIVDDTSKKFKLKTAYIKSNFRNVIRELVLNEYFEEELKDNWWHGVEHGLALLGHVAPYAYQYGIKTHYIPATYSKSDKNVTCASYPTIDENLEFCGCKIIHEGFDKNRQDKLNQICNYHKKTKIPLTIRACYMERGGKTNCCNCEKCFRTIMGIVAEKQEPRDFGFNITKNDIKNIGKKLQVILNTNKKAIHHWHDIQKKALKNKEYFDNEYYKWLIEYKF